MAQNVIVFIPMGHSMSKTAHHQELQLEHGIVFIPMGHSMSKTIFSSWRVSNEDLFLSPWVIQCQRRLRKENAMSVKSKVFLSPWVIQCQRLNNSMG